MIRTETDCLRSLGFPKGTTLCRNDDILFPRSPSHLTVDTYALPG